MSDFEQAQKDVKTLTRRPENDDMLLLYACYKQATVGDANGQRPGMFDLVGRAKYDAWAALTGTSQADAQARYVRKVRDLLADEGR